MKLNGLLTFLTDQRKDHVENFSLEETIEVKNRLDNDICQFVSTETIRGFLIQLNYKI